MMEDLRWSWAKYLFSPPLNIVVIRGQYRASRNPSLSPRLSRLPTLTRPWPTAPPRRAPPRVCYSEPRSHYIIHVDSLHSLNISMGEEHIHLIRGQGFRIWGLGFGLGLGLGVGFSVWNLALGVQQLPMSLHVMG